MKKCLIYGASNSYSYLPEPGQDALVIAVDGGYLNLQKLNVNIDFIIGDFDSLDKSILVENEIQGKLIELEKEKDDTDTLSALKTGLKEGCKDFHIFGGTGGRISHTLANVQCLNYLTEHGARGFLYGQDYIMTCIRNESIEFNERNNGYISIFSQSEVSKGVSIKGLKYELDEAEISNTFPIGVSNEFTGKKSKITVIEGCLLIVYPNKKRRIKL